MKVRLRCEAPEYLAGGMAVQCDGRVTVGLPRLAESNPQRQIPKRRSGQVSRLRERDAQARALIETRLESVAKSINDRAKTSEVMAAAILLALGCLGAFNIRREALKLSILEHCPDPWRCCWLCAACVRIAPACSVSSTSRSLSSQFQPRRRSAPNTFTCIRT
jgi:hypothetical protein